jgi:hypothetical protein
MTQAVPVPEDKRSTGPVMKIQRALEHIAAVESAVGAWLATDAYSIVREQDATGLTALRVRLTQDPPARIALLVGDVVHNLRSALDHAVYDVALGHAGGELSPEAERELMYPIIDPSRDPAKGPEHWAVTFDKQARQRLCGVPDSVRGFIKDEQPYRWITEEDTDGYRYHWLWRVNELDRIDKHRRLAVTAAALENPAVGIPEGVDPRTEFFHAHGPVRNRQMFLRYEGAEAGVQPMWNRGVVVVDAGPDHQHVVPMLQNLTQRVAWVTHQVAALGAS